MSNKSRFLLILWSILGAAVIGCILITQSGCVSEQRIPINTDPKGSDAPLIKAQVYNEMVIVNLRAAIKASIGPIVDTLQAALINSESVDTYLIRSVAVVRWWADSWGEQYKTIERQNVKIENHETRWRESWVAGRFWRAFRWIVGISSLIAVGLFVWHWVLTGGGFLSAVISFLPASGVLSRVGGLRKR